MKKGIRGAAAALCLIMTALPAYAADLTAVVSFDPENGFVTVAGYAQGHTIIKTLPQGMAEDDVTVKNLFTDIDQIYASGEYSYTFAMPEGAAYGKYNVYAVGDGKASDSFMYYDLAMADERIPMLNAQKTAGDLKDVIDENTAVLGIDADDPAYSAYAGKTAVLLHAVFLPLANSTDFYNKYSACIAMMAMSSSTQAEVEAALLKYQQNLGVDYTAGYAALDSGMRADICRQLSVMDFAAEFRQMQSDGIAVSFANLFERCKALAAVRTADSWKGISEAFTVKYPAVLGTMMTANKDYRSEMESSVFMKLAELAPFAGFQDLKEKFYNAVESTVAETEKTNTKTSGGGGSGRGSGSAVGIPADFVNPAEQYDSTTGEPSGAANIPTSMETPTLGGEAASYSDITADNWAYSAVTKLGGAGIVSGYEDGSFRPANSITRAEFAKLMVSAFRIKANAAAFSDVTDSAWYYSYVSAAAGSGIVTGYDGMFHPDAPITREDAAVIIYRVSVALGKNYSGEAKFTDLNDISLYAITAVRGLGNAGIINGDEMRKFNPKAQLTRAEAAQILYNFIADLAQ